MSPSIPNSTTCTATTRSTSPSRKRTNPTMRCVVSLLTAATLLCPAQSFQVSVGPTTSPNTATVPLKYSNDADLQIASSGVTVDDLVKKSQNPKKTVNNSAPNIFQADSKEECERLAAESLDRLTVFRFFAPWCRACKRVAPRFEKLAREYPDVNFVNVAFNEASKKFITQDLAIPSIPYGGVFHPEAGFVEKMNIKMSQFGNFEKIVQSYVKQECELPQEEESSEDELIFAAPYLRPV